MKLEFFDLEYEGTVPPLITVDSCGCCPETSPLPPTPCVGNTCEEITNTDCVVYTGDNIINVAQTGDDLSTILTNLSALTIEGIQGEQGDTGLQGDPGDPGLDGEDGVSPELLISDISMIPAGEEPFVSEGPALPGTYNYELHIPYGAAGTDGSDGKSVAELFIFLRQVVGIPPSTHGVSEYDFATGILTPPGDWSITVPSGSDPCWIATTTAVSDTIGGVVALSWSSATIAFRNGYDGVDGRGVDHITLFSTLGKVKTYKMWADAGETDLIETFIITDGIDGMPGANSLLYSYDPSLIEGIQHAPAFGKMQLICVDCGGGDTEDALTYLDINQVRISNTSVDYAGTNLTIGNASSWIDTALPAGTILQVYDVTNSAAYAILKVTASSDDGSYNTYDVSVVSASTEYMGSIHAISYIPIIGGGTVNRIPKWTPNGYTLGNSLLEDNGTKVFLYNRLPYQAYPAFDTSLLQINTNSNMTSVSITNEYVDESPYGLPSGSTAAGLVVVSYPEASVFDNVTGLTGSASHGNINNIGGIFAASSVPMIEGSVAYAVQLIDATQGLGKVLHSVTPQGHANWVTPLEVNISATSMTELTCVASGGIAPYTYQWSFQDDFSSTKRSLTNDTTTVVTITTTKREFILSSTSNYSAPDTSAAYSLIKVIVTDALGNKTKDTFLFQGSTIYLYS